MIVMVSSAGNTRPAIQVKDYLITDKEMNKLPEFAVTGEVYKSIIVDGKLVKGESYHIVGTPKFVVYRMWIPGKTIKRAL